MRFDSRANSGYQVPPLSSFDHLEHAGIFECMLFSVAFYDLILDRPPPRRVAKNQILMRSPTRFKMFRTIGNIPRILTPTVLVRVEAQKVNPSLIANLVRGSLPGGSHPITSANHTKNLSPPPFLSVPQVAHWWVFAAALRSSFLMSSTTIRLLLLQSLLPTVWRPVLILRPRSSASLNGTFSGCSPPSPKSLNTTITTRSGFSSDRWEILFWSQKQMDSGKSSSSLCFSNYFWEVFIFWRGRRGILIRMCETFYVVWSIYRLYSKKITLSSIFAG